MMTTKARFFVTAFATIALGAISACAQQEARPDSFTADQATAGRANYVAMCAPCHMPDLKGSNEALPLSGLGFTSVWRSRTTRDLFERISTTMPPGKAGLIPEQDVLSLVAFILQTNGARPGTKPLTATAAIPIGELASGEATVAAQQEASDGTRAPPVRPARAAGPPAGITVSGEVKDYVAVTDEMLHRPDPSDWLMIRGNYQAWN